MTDRLTQRKIDILASGDSLLGKLARRILKLQRDLEDKHRGYQILTESRNRIVSDLEKLTVKHDELQKKYNELQKRYDALVELQYKVSRLTERLRYWYDRWKNTEEGRNVTLTEEALSQR